MLFGPDGAAEGLGEGGLAIDMSTIAPSASRAIGDRLRERGIAFLDAPVTGSKPKAEDGTLTIMVGGEAADFERARPLFEAMGKLVLHVGPQGHGSMVKLINNTTAAVNTAAVAEGIAARPPRGARPRQAARGDRRRIGRLRDAGPEGAADHRARLRAALQARPHAQGRAALPRGGEGARRGHARRLRGRAAVRRGRRRRPLRRRLRGRRGADANERRRSRAATAADIDAVLAVWAEARSAAARTPDDPEVRRSGCSSATPARCSWPRSAARSSAC